MELGLEESGYASPFASPLYRWDDKRWALLFTLTREETGGKKSIRSYVKIVSRSGDQSEKRWKSLRHTVCHDGPRRDKETLDASVNKIVLACI